ncbi:hypothetical protein PCANC_27714 [Puccinia coronata f. sp. avenae]|uniref:Uncharacterized protein n=1 Tax=Puccinia coronata f. sp. avenae TaxID=200324 RepID=A0A2N5TRW8_9BASI|nr:hypothetical protein PCANC_27714 [Puccinia coronata f. sp. avenae]
MSSNSLLALSATLRSSTQSSNAGNKNEEQQGNNETAAKDLDGTPKTEIPLETPGTATMTQNAQTKRRRAEERASIASRIGASAHANKEPLEENGTGQQRHPHKRSEAPDPANVFRDTLRDLVRRAMEGEKESAEMYYDMYRSLKRDKEPSQPTPLSRTKRKHPGEDTLELPETTLEDSTTKSDINSDDKLVVGDLKFTSGAIPKHNKMGFTPYFNKNIHELKGPIPLKIFNETWKNTPILYHSDKRAKSEDVTTDRNRYTGFPYPSEWTQTFAEWTTNHQGFYQTLVTEYNFKKFGKWFLAQKANADAIRAEDGFMAAL